MLILHNAPQPPSLPATTSTVAINTPKKPNRCTTALRFCPYGCRMVFMYMANAKAHSKRGYGCLTRPPFLCTSPQRSISRTKQGIPNDIKHAQYHRRRLSYPRRSWVMGTFKFLPRAASPSCVLLSIRTDVLLLSRMAKTLFNFEENTPVRGCDQPCGFDRSARASGEYRHQRQALQGPSVRLLLDLLQQLFLFPIV